MMEFTKEMEEEIYRNAVIKFGIDAQREMLVEECSELIKAIMKFLREERYLTRTQQAVREDIIPLRDNYVEEIADVQIMLNQVILMDLSEHEKELLEQKKLQKLARLQVRINRHEIEGMIRRGETPRR